MSGSVALDLTLLCLLGLYAWSGWRQGFVSAVLGLVGLLGGAFLALRIVPGLLEDHLDVYRATPAGVLALVAAVVAAALLGQGLMLLLARRFRDVMTAPTLRAVDSGLGLVAVLVAAMAVTWVVAGAVAASGPRVARDIVARSAVVSALDGLVPSSADGLVDEMTQAFDGSVFPKVFEGLGPEPIAPVAAPDGTVTTGPGRRAGARLGRARTGRVRVLPAGPGRQRLGRGTGAGGHQRPRRGRGRPHHGERSRHRARAGGSGGRLRPATGRRRPRRA